MYMKVFEHGTGRGDKAINYLLDPKRKGREQSPPTVLRGDPELLLKVINATSRKWKYTSGVLSWSPEDKITPEKEQQIMDSFESFAFAGLEPDQYTVLWVRHDHNPHHELHFIMPRTELYKGKALNPCPPNWQKQYDVWRDLWNEQENWARPDDPKRARLVQLGKANQFHSDKVKIKKQITEYLAQGIKQGLYQAREDLITALETAGFVIPRKGKEYITLQSPKGGQGIRLKGGIYAASWRADQQIKGTSELGSAGNGKERAERITRLRQELEAIRTRRAEYNQKRYGYAVTGAEKKAIQHFVVSLEAKSIGQFSRGIAFSDSLSLHNRLLQLEAQAKLRGISFNQSADSKAEGEHQQVHKMGHHSTSSGRSKISGLSQGGELRDSAYKRRQASPYIQEVIYERTGAEPTQGLKQNGEGTKHSPRQAGQTDRQAGTGGARLSRIAKRIEWCIEQAQGIIQCLDKIRQWRKHNKNQSIKISGGHNDTSGTHNGFIQLEK